MNPGDDAGPLLPVIRVDLIDKTPPWLSLVFEAHLHLVLRLGVDRDRPEINSPLSRTLG
jgi:hypothetical protein